MKLFETARKVGVAGLLFFALKGLAWLAVGAVGLVAATGAGR